MKYVYKITTMWFLVVMTVLSVEAQQIKVKLDEPKQEFEGAGVSIGLFMGHHYSMNAENQAKAIRMINKDLNMKYLQDYIGIYPSDDAQYFDRRANYIKAAKVHRPDIQVSMVGNIFPDNLRTDIVVNGRTYAVLDTDDPEIYDKLADWYFQLFKGFHDRGVEVDIFNVVNEPDLANCANQCRKYHYGLNGDTQKAVALVFTQAVPKFLEMLNDPQINTTNMKVPLIMGPSTISPNGCLSYLRYFKANYPEAWDLIDIVATHQYINGARNDLFEEILVEAEGKPIHQSETHASRFANQADDLGTLPVSDGHRTSLSLARLFGVAVNNGTSAWYYFENNYPNEFHPGGLIHVAWASENPVPYKHYYAYQQLTTAQPAFSNVMEQELVDIGKSEIVSFRKSDEDTVYVNIANFTGDAKAYLVQMEDNTGLRDMSAMTVTNTDETNDANVIENTVFTAPQDRVIFRADPYSLNTLKLTLSNVITSLEDRIDRSALRVWQEGKNLMVETRTTAIIESFSLVSAHGQYVIESAKPTNGRLEIALNTLNSGVYLVNVVTSQGRESRKIHVNN
ncbi:MAG: T9SS type A sorting domain-containing protein [Bacteroidota bacterium]